MPENGASSSTMQMEAELCKKSFVAFICKVDNAAVLQEKKSDRMKIVVEAAEEFWGIKKLKAEYIYAMLRTNNDVGSLNNN